MDFSIEMDWSEDEEKMHRLLRVPPQENPTSTHLTAQASAMFRRAPLLAFGTLDAQARPWVTLWGGSPGFTESIGGGAVGTSTLVDGKHDPVVQALVAGSKEFEKPREREDAKLVAGLSIDLMTGKRIKTAGRLVGCMVREIEDEAESDDAPAEPRHMIRVVTMIEQSLGNCPKYINQYEIHPAPVSSKLVAEGASLSDEAQAVISASDMFFLSTSTPDDMDVNHRGGSPGFVRIISPVEIVYPEYSGNRLYQSLGNLQLVPKIGLAFPNYSTGDMLYITGSAQILVGKDAAYILPASNLAVKIVIEDSRLVRGGLPFRGTQKKQSPYNPRVRPLASEGNLKSTLASSRGQTAHLTKKTLLTPSIARFTFSVPDAGFSYTRAQWVALDFKEELDMGYQHMSDDDPTSLNDDFVRTFTISSTPPVTPSSAGAREFDVTIRKVGPVTRFLFQTNERAGLQVSVLGVGGGDFVVKQEEPEAGKVVPFVAAGVGITPLLGQVAHLELLPERFRLFWAVRGEDVGFVEDTFARHPGLAACTRVFLTGKREEGEVDFGNAVVERRRMGRGDLEGVEADVWYMCVGKGMRKEVLEWLEGKKVVFEDFDY